MARKCTICEHAQLEEINKDLIEGTSLSEIVAKHSGITKTSLFRHKENHLPGALSKAHEAGEIAQANIIMGELKRCFERVNLLFDAADRWLRDPEDHTRYDLSPRADEVTVIYHDPVRPGEKQGKAKKATISQLLAKIDGAGYQTASWETKFADPRTLLLQTAKRLQGQIELLGKLTGELQQEGTVNITVAPEWLELRAVILRVLEPYPEARLKLVRAVQEVEKDVVNK